MATVVRAPPKDFRVVRQEWAAIRIQTAFRGFLVNGFLFYFFVLGSFLTV
jgi:predicted deacetylase